jgi:hypothetical protein
MGFNACARLLNSRRSLGEIDMIKIPFIKKIACLRYSESVTKKVQAWIVPESPFNGLKVFFMIFLLGLVGAGFIGFYFITDTMKGFILMLIYSLTGSLFFIFKIYQSLKQFKKYYEKI